MITASKREGKANIRTPRAFPGAGSHFARWAVPLLTRHCAGGDLLELGCGSGRDPALLVRRGFRVVGVDYGPEALVHARSRIASLPTVRRGSAEVAEADLCIADRRKSGAERSKGRT
ncbi:MAG: class I SAM-dependent methyltransferase [Thermoplasmata archaeon]